MATSSRPVLGHARNLTLALPSNRRIVYVGADRSNLGDAAMFVAHQNLLPCVRLCDFPGGGRNRVLRVLAVVNRHRLAIALVLGGGTLVGRPAYRQRVEAIFRVLGPLPSFVLSVGVEDPSFNRGSRRRVDAELERWADLLSRFDTVGVRGPRSQAILRNVGIVAEVVGDPALALADDRPTDQVVSRLLGLNVGVSRDLWGDPGTIIDRISSFGRVMTERGWSIRLFPMWPKDTDYVREAARRIGPRAEIFSRNHDINQLLAGIRECEVFVGEKLHSVVLASATYVPSIMLEYRPKCLDFQMSIGRGEFTMRTDDLSVDRLIDMVDELSMNRESHSRAIRASVIRRREQLRQRAMQIRCRLAQTSE